MTSPVCPACRTTITLDVHACPRCGLAVRPTCSSCGEALEVRMHACPRCWEVIEFPAPFVEGAVLYAPVAAQAPQLRDYGYQAAVVATAPAVAAPVATAPAPVAAPVPTQHIPVVDYAPKTRSVGARTFRFIVIALVSGLVAAIGLVALEGVGPRLRGNLPEQVRLVRREFPKLDFAMGIPAQWDVVTDDGAKPTVTVREMSRRDGAGVLREFQVIVDGAAFDRARQVTEVRAPPSARNYDEIDIIDGLRLDGRRAFRHLYTDDDEYREVWWIQRGKGTYRLEFRSPVSRREESAALNVRIARTFDVL